MSLKQITTPKKSSSKPKPKSISVPKTDFGFNLRLSERGKGENLLNAKLPDIARTQTSEDPSPLLQQDINDLLGVIVESPNKSRIPPEDNLDFSLGSVLNTANQVLCFEKEETITTLQKQLATLRSEINIKNSLIEKLMKENNDLKNEMGVFMASVEDNKENIDTKTKQLNERLKHLEEENKHLRQENKASQEQLTLKSTLVNDLAEKIESYHQTNKKSLDYFMNNFKSQITDLMRDSQKQYNQINTAIQGNLRKVRKDNKPYSNTQRDKIDTKQRLEVKNTASCSKAENRATLAQTVAKTRKQSANLACVTTSDHSEEEKPNILFKKKTFSENKPLRQSYTPKNLV